MSASSRISTNNITKIANNNNIINTSEYNENVIPNKQNGSLKVLNTSNQNDINLDKLLNQVVDTSNMDENEKKIVAEFIHLLEKSRQLFNGLRELPQYGHKNSQWQAYFGRTFDVYTKLWKFQQQHRQVLDLKYNLKRWQIGEIASKIGQLYYHYYLRTSESNYLNESYSFYQAIQTRSYYSKANKEEKFDGEKVKILCKVHCCMFIIKKTKQVRDLIRELGRQIDDYVKIYDPEDQLEWQMVKNEINDFIEADSILNVDSVNVSLSNRLIATQVPVISSSTASAYSNEIFKSISSSLSMSTNNNVMTTASSAIVSLTHLTLQEIIIIGNCQDQIKFSELSLDMFRMLQAVEREPTAPNLNNNTIVNNDKSLINNESKSPATNLFINEVDRYKADNSTTQTIIQRENPNKYLLYKPSFSQFYTYLAAAFKDLPPNGVLMLYISADGCETHMRNPHEHAYDFGGLRTSNKKDSSSGNNNNNNQNNNHNNSINSISNQSDGNYRKTSSHYKDVHCIHPGDIYPFLRKPLFLIVDSYNSAAFQNFPNLFGQPFISLLSPVNLPSIFQDQQNQQGNIFTLFLTSPLFAFCYICNISNLTADLFTKCQNQIKSIFSEIAKAFYKSKSVDNVYSLFCHDDFIRVFVLRFVFCYCSLRLHRGFKGPEYYPTSQPQLSNDIIENTQVQKLILDLATILNIRQLFLDVNDD